MPRFHNLEPRMRGFNGNKIVFGPNDPPKTISKEDLAWLKEDPSFVECVRTGKMRDLDGAMIENAPVVEKATPEGAPSHSTPAMLLQIEKIETTAELDAFAKNLPAMSADDFKPVKDAIFGKRMSLALMKK